MLWVITYVLISYGELDDFEVKGLFKGSEEEVNEYVQELNKEDPSEPYDYWLAEMLN